jgi:hypothetical protein
LENRSRQHDLDGIGKKINNNETSERSEAGTPAIYGREHDQVSRPSHPEEAVRRYRGQTRASVTNVLKER